MGYESPIIVSTSSANNTIGTVAANAAAFINVGIAICASIAAVTSAVVAADVGIAVWAVATLFASWFKDIRVLPSNG